MLNIVLYQPEIPPNTGNIIRLAANSGANLHLIEPFGFELDDKRLRRAGLDYQEFADLNIHANWDDFHTHFKHNSEHRLYALSTRGTTVYSKARFQAGDYLLFGPETRGLPTSIIHELPIAQQLRIPMQPDSRSLNLSNCAALVMYEALRQLDFGDLR